MIGTNYFGAGADGDPYKNTIPVPTERVCSGCDGGGCDECSETGVDVEVMPVPVRSIVDLIDNQTYFPEGWDK